MNWLFSSSIGKKLIMAISGAFLVLFLFFHMSMNLVLVFSKKNYDVICELLGANWYAIVGTILLAGGAFVHIVYGICLTCQNKVARGSGGYFVNNKTKTKWASQNMLLLGLIIFLGLLIHLINFWAKMQLSELFHCDGAVKSGSRLVIGLFSNPAYSCIYVIWIIAIWFHLTHGIWSAFQTVGWNNRKWLFRIQVISNIVSTIILIGFLLVPIYFTFFY